MEDILIKNATVIPVRPADAVLKEHSILVREGRIAALGPYEEITGKFSTGDAVVIDGSGKLVLPGFINGHTHLPETLLRGICDDEMLEKWLWENVWVWEGRMTPKEAKAGSMLGCLELIKNGVTGFIDQFYYANEIAEAVAESGIRGLLCPSVFDNNAEAGSIDNCFKRACEVVDQWYGKNERVTWGMGPHAPYTVDKEWLWKIKDFGHDRGLPIHIHMQETQWEVDEAMKSFGKTPFQYLEEIGLLSERILAAHCVVSTPEDRKIMAARDIHVLHNPTSNLKLSSGIAPVNEYLDAGINVSVGTDGNGSNNDLDMLTEIQLAALLQKYSTGKPTAMPLSRTLDTATINGARAMGLDKDIGTLEVGKYADIIIMDCSGPNMNPQHNLLSNLVYSSSSKDIETVLVGGRIIMKDREVLTMDEKKVIEDAADAMHVLRGD